MKPNISINKNMPNQDIILSINFVYIPFIKQILAAALSSDLSSDVLTIFSSFIICSLYISLLTNWFFGVIGGHGSYVY